ncbi:hypothetical protein BDV95DRAFT_600044 [Massariosphaeria phaeospora]|uniref:Uncharacterized protein n=1 Tax=Massariosphaeria phaeospora TaxID=100035 RepID=A0A7C8HYG4_9PLEO|nr:hypothetical protein BDV95DRAFT_600044 [Massariosphaeria phaeospora]
MATISKYIRVKDTALWNSVSLDTHVTLWRVIYQFQFRKTSKFDHRTFGKFPFSQAKTVDVAWDICIGRGAQFLAWWVAYVVFSDALFRVIERHPASYRVFSHISLNGACLASLWALLRELFRTRSKRTWALFFYMFLSTLWVLSMPTVLGAMTGYVSTTVGWVEVNGSDEIVPATKFKQTTVVWGTKNETWESGWCAVSEQMTRYLDEQNDRTAHCDCQMPDGKLYNYGVLLRQPNSNVSECNATTFITIGKHSYDAETLDYNYYDYCIGDRAYRSEDVWGGTTRCLPDTADPAYQWGFSTMLSGLFVFVQVAWSMALYAVWQDAQFNSEIVRSGYRMTQLRAAFALTVCAGEATGLRDGELVTEEGKGLERRLYGRKKDRGAEVGYGTFRRGGKEWEDGESYGGEVAGLRERRRGSVVQTNKLATSPPTHTRRLLTNNNNTISRNTIHSKPIRSNRIEYMQAVPRYSPTHSLIPIVTPKAWPF